MLDFIKPLIRTVTGPQRPPKTANLAPKRQRRDVEVDQELIDSLGNIVGDESSESEEVGELDYIYFGGSDTEDDDSDTDYEP